VMFIIFIQFVNYASKKNEIHIIISKGAKNDSSKSQGSKKLQIMFS